MTSHITQQELESLPLETLPKEQRAELLALLEENAKRKLFNYRPYPKQVAFHAAGLTHRERLFRAGNQLGKTLGGAAEAAMHATGRYPEWWPGRRINKANDGWCSGVTGEVTRDTIQRLLLGTIGREGSGFIPERDIQEKIMSRGVADLVDTLLVKHQMGGVSRIKFKYYEQGREKFQADTIDWAWNDEEPPQDIYTEILTRTNATGGFLWTTFTPLLGMSEVVRRFLQEVSPDRADICMTIDDVGHIGPKEKAQILASYPAHEREARLNGTPMLGSGRIFPVTEESIRCARFEIPKWYFFIGGLDFGWDHPTAAVKLAYNPDLDTVYVVTVYKRSEATPVIHASALRSWGSDLLWSWPHDGLQHDKGSGEKLADQYRNAGLNMLPERATFDDGSNGVEAGIMEMLTRMENGTFKVFEECKEFFDEFRMYHRKDGKVVKEYDDVISACLHPDSEVITRKGTKNISSLVGTSGEVLSIDGKWESYKNCRMTKRDAELVRVTFSDGHKLLCTPDHKLLSDRGEWIEAIDSKGMICHDAVSSSVYTEKCRTSNIKGQSIVSTIHHRMAIMLARGAGTCIGLCTETIGGKFPKAMSYIIKTVLKPIIFFSTSKLWNWANTPRCTRRGMEELQHGFMSHRKNGANLRGVENSLVKWAKRIGTICLLKSNLFAVSVANNLSRLIADQTVFVPMLANPNGVGMLGWMMSSENVNTVQKNFWPTDIAKVNFAQNHAEENFGQEPQRARHTLSVLQVEFVKERSDVYCMEVPGTEAFALSNGAVVHNCRYGLMSLRFARPMGAKPTQGQVSGAHHVANYDPLTLDAARGK